MVLGERLRYYRKEANLTQEQLADGICAATYISKVENGKTDMPDVTLKEICTRMGITLNQLKGEIDGNKISLLKEWYEEIKRRDEKNARKLFEDLRTTFQGMDDPLLMAPYYLVYFRYSLFLRDNSSTQQLYKKVQNLKEWMTGNWEFYYHNFLGLYEYLNGSLKVALKKYKQAEKIAVKQKIDEPELLYHMALVYSRLKNTTQSTIYAYRALQMFGQEMNFERCTDCNMLLGINFNLIEDHELAKEYFTKVLKAAETQRNATTTKSKAHHNLGFVYSKKKQPQKAIEHLEKSLQLKTNPAKKINTLYLLTKEYMTIGNKDNAKKSLLTGIRYAKEFNDREYELKLNILQYQLFDETQSKDYCELLKKEALPYFKNRGDSFACDCAEHLGDYFSAHFQYKEALYYFQLANELRKNI